MPNHQAAVAHPRPMGIGHDGRPSRPNPQARPASAHWVFCAPRPPDTPLRPRALLPPPPTACAQPCRWPLAQTLVWGAPATLGGGAAGWEGRASAMSARTTTHAGGRGCPILRPTPAGKSQTTPERLQGAATGALGRAVLGQRRWPAQPTTWPSRAQTIKGQGGQREKISSAPAPFSAANPRPPAPRGRPQTPPTPSAASAIDHTHTWAAGPHSFLETNRPAERRCRRAGESPEGPSLRWPAGESEREGRPGEGL